MKNEVFFLNLYLLTLSGALLYLIIDGSDSNFKTLAEDTKYQVSRTSLSGFPTVAVILIFLILATENRYISLGHVYPLILILLAIFGTMILFDYIEVHELGDDTAMTETNQLLGIITGSASIFYFAFYLYYETFYMLPVNTKPKRK